MAPEIYLTSTQARTRFNLSESGLRAAVLRGDFPSPIQIGGKRLFAMSRLDAFERELNEAAAQREAKAKEAKAALFAQEVAAATARERAAVVWGAGTRRRK